MIKLKTGKLTAPLFIMVFILLIAPTALAATNLIQPVGDLPPGTMNYGNPDRGNLPADPNIIAAIIGVLGLLVGSGITILATLIFRHMDIRREDRKEETLMRRDKKEKEYQIKQEIYKDFLHELSQLETFNFDNLESFKKDWTKTEIKVDLVASPKVRAAKEMLQKELFNIAEKNLKSGSASLSTNYLRDRDSLLDSIREDIDIFN